MYKISENAQRIAPSATMAISSRAKAMRAEGQDVIALAAGEPDFPTPAHICEAAKAALDEGFTKYTPAAGMPALRAAWAAKIGQERSVTYEPGQLIVTNGGKQAVYNTIYTLAGAGDEVILLAPYWVSYSEQVKAVGATPVIIQTRLEDEFKVRPDALRAAITQRTTLVILNSPSNPTGSVYTRQELEALAEVLIEKQVPVMSDEVYDALVYGETFVSPASLSKEMYDLTIIVGAVSKAYAMTGWRIGFAAGPKEIIGASSRLQSHSTSGANSIAQKAALAAITGDQSGIEVMRQAFDQRRQYMLSRLGHMHGVSCFEPKGAFYTFPDVSANYQQRYQGEYINNSMDFCRLLLEHAKVAAIPGGAFGNDKHIRLSYATSMEQITEALNRMEQFIARID